MANDFPPTAVPGLRVRPQDDVPGLRVRPQDDAPGLRIGPQNDVPGFDLDENGMPRQEGPWLAKAAHPGLAMPQYPGLAPTLNEVPPEWLSGPLTMKLPPSPYGALIVPPRRYPAMDMNVGATDGASSDARIQPVGFNADPNIVLANAGEEDVQEAQQKRPPTPPTPGRATPLPLPQRPPAQAGKQPSAPPRRERSGEEITQLAESRREEALNEVRYKAAREERAPYWDYMLQQLPRPPLPGSHIQAPLPQDWRAFLKRINPSYVDYTEAAAMKYGIPPELLARLLYRESNYENKNVDRDGNVISRGNAVGISQMYGPALRDVGIDPETFSRAGAAAQIDAGAAYLAKQYRRFGDWPRAVAAYHSGAQGIEDWLTGKAPNYDNIKQRAEEESAFFRWNKKKKEERKSVEERKAAARENAEGDLHRWQELQAYLPYVFLGDPDRYGRARGR